MSSLVRIVVTGVAGALVMGVLIAADSPLTLRDDGIKFPDGTLQTTAMGDTRVPVTSLPYVIDESGSYVLAEDATSEGPFSGPAINILAHDVTLDLAGFALDGSKGGTDGTLIGIAAFSGGDRSVQSGDTVNVTVTLTAQTA